MNDLIVCAGRPGVRISIISDNAKRVQDADFVKGARQRRAPRRSASTPLDHMSSRWEPSFGPTDEKSLHQSDEGRKSRWESHSIASARTIELMRPRRESFRDVASRFSDHDTSMQLKSHNTLKNHSTEMATSKLPKSLRSLPY